MSDGRFAQDSDAAPDDVTIPDPTDPFQQGLNPPAPIIDLGGDVAAGPSRPLGPRRLALLREQMAQHQRELERSGADDPTNVDPVLAQKQKRIAELASRAAISSEEDRQLADEAFAQTQSIQPITDDYLASLDEQERDNGGSSLEEEPQEPSEKIGHLDRASEADPTDTGIQQTPWSEPVPVVPAAPSQEQDQLEAEHASPEVDDQSRDLADELEGVEPASEPAEGPADDDLDAAPENVEQTGSTEPVEESSSSLESAEGADAEATEHSAQQEAADQVAAASDEDEQAPSEPVRAVNAQGLQLMDPKDYRTPGDWRTPVLTITAILVLALLAVLIVFFVL